MLQWLDKMLDCECRWKVAKNSLINLLQVVFALQVGQITTQSNEAALLEFHKSLTASVNQIDILHW